MRHALFRLIAIFEIAGGLYGLAGMLYRLAALGSNGSLLHALIGALLFGFVLLSGVLLLEGTEHGIQLSRWAQLLQLPLIATPAFSYALHSGAYLNVFATVQATTPRLALEWHVGTQGFVLALAGPALSRIGINLLALLSWLALRLR